MESTERQSLFLPIAGFAILIAAIVWMLVR